MKKSERKCYPTEKPFAETPSFLKMFGWFFLLLNTTKISKKTTNGFRGSVVSSIEPNIFETNKAEAMLTTMTIGNKIAIARDKIKLSQAQLANRPFISLQAVRKWEHGECMPDIITFSRLVEILGVDLNHFSEAYQSVDSENNSMESISSEATVEISDRLK